MQTPMLEKSRQVRRHVLQQDDHLMIMRGMAWLRPLKGALCGRQSPGDYSTREKTQGLK